jgi:hypothetical protein
MTMPDLDTLKEEIKASLAAAASRAAEQRKDFLRDQDELKQRLARFDATVEQFCTVWRPRLQSLVEQFSDLVEVKPVIQPHSRESTFSFASDKYRVELKFSAGPDKDVRQMILDYDLSIIPALIKFDGHKRLELPLDQVNEEVIAHWLDERILEFVDTYVTLQGDDFFLEHMNHRQAGA